MRFTEQHHALRRTTEQFVEQQVNPYVDEWEAQGRFPAAELFKKMGDLGLLGIAKPEQYGGLGLDYSYQIVFAEAFGRVHCGAIPMAVGVQTDMATPALARFGNDALRREFLAPAIAGERVAALGVSEVGAGSDVAAIKTTARKDGADYLINGSKMWMTNSLQSDFICLLANTSDDAPHKNKSLIVVPSNTPGITFSEPLKKLGMHSSDTAQVFFDDVRVPQHHLIGTEGAGFTQQMIQFQEERLFCAAMSLGSMELCIEATIDYTANRQAFGQRILDNQAVQFRLAELQTEVELLRALVYDGVEGYINGEDVSLKASMAKLKSGRLTREVTDSCLQYWGGMGFMWENLVSRFYRDNRLGSIGGGADEVMLGIIGKQMNLHRR